MTIGRRQSRRRSHAAFVMCMVGFGGFTAAQEDASSSQAPDHRERILWKYAPAGCKFSGIVVDNGTVFAVDRQGKVHALDAASGLKQWTSDGHRFDSGYGLALSADPDFEALLVGSDDGLSALDRKTGKTIWHTPIAAGVAGPACTKAAVIAGSADGKVYAFKLRTGESLWEHGYLDDRPDDPEGFAGEQARFSDKLARPRDANTDGKMVVLSIFDQCRMLALDAASGKRLWDFRTQGWMYGRPSIGPRNVFVGSQDRRFYAVDKEMGKLAWDVETGARVEGSAAPTERFVYFGSCDGNLYSVDQVVGRVEWKFSTESEEGRGAPIYSRPLVNGDKVYLAALRGKVYALNRRTGKLLWDFRPLEKSELNSDLAAEDGRLFLTTRQDDGSGESAVLAIDMR